MAKISGRIRRTLSCLLAAAMIVTAVPQTGIPIYASETESMADEGGLADSGTEETVGDTAGKDTADESGSDGSEASGEAGQENGDPKDGSESEETVVDETAPGNPSDGNETPSGETKDEGQEDSGGDNTSSDDAAKKDQQDGDEVNTDETPDGDEAAAGEQESDEEKEELEEAEVQNYATGEESGDGQEVKKINVNINLPYYENPQNYREWIPYLTAFSYAVGDAEEFTEVDLGSLDVRQSKYSYSIPVEAGKSLRFKFACKDNARMKDVQWKSHFTRESSGGFFNYSDPKIMEAAEDVYTLKVMLRDNYYEYIIEDYVIDINVLQTWKITFVDLYARNHNGTASIEVYQKQKYSGDGTDEPADLIGQTITVDSEEWERCYYVVKAKEGFTFDSMAASASGVTVKKEKIEGETYAYRLEKNASVPDNITIFVTAEESQNKRITLNMPSEVTNAMNVAVYGKRPSEENYARLTLTDGAADVPDDMAVYVAVTSDNMAYMVQATYQETGGEPEPFAESDVDTRVEDGSWTREYILGTLNHVKDGITINLSRAKVNQVRMAVNWGAVSEIGVNAPVSGYYSGDGVTTYVPEGETLKFYVEMVSDKGAACVSTEDGKEIGIDHDDTYWGTVRSYYNIVPTSDMAISVKGREYE